MPISNTFDVFCQIVLEVVIFAPSSAEFEDPPHSTPPPSQH